ncbi:MAG TPA: hypothetical protein PKM57_01670 [Kiritimatiellia bacterium]|nr:hypothetical protein [Kiritimatiellia bacterium]HPS08548.1 hypothetical protein [Kiritimatiellia bacterium]
MKNVYLQAALVLGLAFCCVQTKAQDPTYTLTNQNTSAETTFTNTLGTSELSGSMIVFEGQLEAAIPVAKGVNPTTGFYVASLQLLTQIKLFDELPASNEVGNVQGAVAALRDAPESTDGTYYVWAVTNSTAPIAWVPLYVNGTTTPITVKESATNYITFVFNYTALTNSTPGPVTYQVFIGATPTTQVASESMVSATSEAAGINGVSLLGVGGLEAFSSATGVTGPLSSSIGFSVYATANGVLLVLDPVNEQGSGWFTVFAEINGQWVEVGKVQADGSGHYEFIAYPGLLQVGQSYKFHVVDEIGNGHDLGQAVAIKTIKMEKITMTPEYMTVNFNSEAGRFYQVFSAESLTAETWTATTIYYPVDGGNWDYGSEPFTAAGTTTTIRIPRNTTKGFFKIRKVNVN